MPITYRVDAALRLLEAIFTGEVTMEEFRQVGDRILLDPSVNSEFRFLLIYDGAKITHTVSELVEHKKRRERTWKAKQIAIVAPTDYEFGLARMYQLATDSIGAKEVKVFRNLKEARAWLGLPDP